MENIIIEVIGYAAGILSVITMIPQIMKSYKIKRVEDVSLLMVTVCALSLLLWTVYGYLINNMPVFIMDLAAFIIVSIQIALIFRYKVKK